MSGKVVLNVGDSWYNTTITVTSICHPTKIRSQGQDVELERRLHMEWLCWQHKEKNDASLLPWAKVNVRALSPTLFEHSLGALAGLRSAPERRELERSKVNNFSSCRDIRACSDALTPSTQKVRRLSRGFHLLLNIIKTSKSSILNLCWSLMTSVIKGNVMTATYYSSAVGRRSSYLFKAIYTTSCYEISQELLQLVVFS
jgi:hypothetical protein